MKLLVLTPEPIDAALLRSAVDDDIEGAEVLVISPASNQSKVAFWVSDSDEAIEEAETARSTRSSASRRRASTPPATPARASPPSRSTTPWPRSRPTGS